MKKALALPRKTRARLAHLLVASLDQPGARIKSRVAGPRDGKVRMTPGEKIIAELRTKCT